jgi:aminopeptidase N
MAHPVRPQSYQQISNFYTSTVYSKGAELVHMIHTLLGPENFRRGIDLYFQRHDGHAVTIDDFVRAMQDAGGVDLRQFKRWYDQSGTPRLDIRDRYDPDSQIYELSVAQSCPPTPGQPEKLPFHLPLTIGLLDADGQDIPLQLEGEPAPQGTSRVLSLRQEKTVLRFVNVPTLPVPSLGRNFSAPVIINYAYSDDALRHLLSFDTDPFNRWEAGQRLALKLLLQGIADYQIVREVRFPDFLADAFGHVLKDGLKDPAFAAEALALSLHCRTSGSNRPGRCSSSATCYAPLPGETAENHSAGNLRGLYVCRELQSRCRVGGSAGPQERVPRLPDGFG